MPIKIQASSNIALLTNYTPYSIGENVLLEDINEMFSYAIQEPQTPIDLQFVFGAVEALIGNLVFKNLTTNATLRVVLEYDTLTFITTPTFELVPEETRTIPVRINAQNMQVGVTNLQKNIKVSVSNITNGSLVYKSSEEPLPTVSFNDTITLYD